MVLIGIGGCKKDSGSSQLLGDTKHTAAGLTWSVPKDWKVGPERQMRVASYLVDPQSGEAEGAECAVFYFGQGVGGDAESNIARWESQFEQHDAPKTETRDIGGVPVMIVQIAGTYLAPSGPMMESSGRKENFRLLGAIIQGPQGLVFFKLTGPAKSIGAATAQFDAMVGSLSK
jgi:hypothetical protein